MNIKQFNIKIFDIWQQIDKIFPSLKERTDNFIYELESIKSIKLVLWGLNKYRSDIILELVEYAYANIEPENGEKVYYNLETEMIAADFYTYLDNIAYKVNLNFSQSVSEDLILCVLYVLFMFSGSTILKLVNYAYIIMEDDV